jgi:hypothetical protein
LNSSFTAELAENAEKPLFFILGALSVLGGE